MAMPRQSRQGIRQQTRHIPSLPARIATIVARLGVFGATGLLTAFGVLEMYAVAAAGGVTPLQWLFLVAFSLTFTWTGFSACQAVAGFIRLILLDVFRRSPATPDCIPGPTPTGPQSCCRSITRMPPESTPGYAPWRTDWPTG